MKSPIDIHEYKYAIAGLKVFDFTAEKMAASSASFWAHHYLVAPLNLSDTRVQTSVTLLLPPHNGMFYTFPTFLPGATLCVSAVFAVARCPPIRLSVTLVDCIQTDEYIVKLLSRPGCPNIVAF